jgi:putative transposase
MAPRNSTADFKNLLSQFIGETDPLFEMLKWTTEQLMKIEVESKVGAAKGQHSRNRATHFSGTRVRRFDTRLGTMYLVVPKLRKGGYIPFFVTEKWRSEQALLQVVQEAFINGVSTRKIDRLAKQLGIENISASQVSEINKGLDEQVDTFRNRPLEAEYPVIWIDALYEKIRDDGRVYNHAVMVVCGLNRAGEREILAIEPMDAENEDNYRFLIQRLKERGLRSVWLVVSDAHLGLKNAIQKEFLGSSWQRCKVHFMRNVLAKVRTKHKEHVAARIKHIWLQPDAGTARGYAKQVMEDLESQFPEVVEILDNGLEDSLQFYEFPKLDHRKVASTNMLERLNREIRRRSKVVGIFPSQDSYLRLVTCYLIEYTEDWTAGKAYIKKEILDEQRDLIPKIAA